MDLSQRNIISPVARTLTRLVLKTQWVPLAKGAECESQDVLVVCHVVVNVDHKKTMGYKIDGSSPRKVNTPLDLVLFDNFIDLDKTI